MSFLSDEDVGYLPVVSRDEQIARDKTAMGIKLAELQQSPNDPNLIKDVMNSQGRLDSGNPFSVRARPSPVQMPADIVPQQQQKQFLSDEDVGFGTAQSKKFLSDTDVGYKQPMPSMPQWTIKDNIAQTFKDSGITDTANSGLVLADMLLGLPGMAMHAGAYWAARGTAGLMGENNSVGAKMAKDIAADIVPDSLSAPLHSVMQYLGYGDNYNSSTVGQAMDFVTQGIEKGSTWLSQKTGGVMQPADFEELANIGMLALGTHGGQAALNKAFVNKHESFVAKQTELPPRDRVEPTFGDEAKPSDTQTTGQTATWKSPDGDFPVTVLEKDFAGTNTRMFSKVLNHEGTESIVPTDELMYQNGTIGDTTSAVGPRSPGEPPVPSKSHYQPSATPEQIGKVTPAQAAAGAAAVAAGGWLYMNPEDAEEIGVGGLMAAGAIRTRGSGVIHPDVVPRLANPLIEKLAPMVDPDRIRTFMDETPGYEPISEPISKGVAAAKWADSRVKNWLNKYAGTPEDPLKDIKIPMMGDEARWEDLTDKMFQPRKVVGSGEIPVVGKSMHEVPGTRPGETVWHVAADENTRAITSYLSHAADYAREFIPADKLQNYDFVRLIKETAKQDEVQAAKMAKARVNQAGTSLVKEYPDGMRWVEVGKSEPLVDLPKGYSWEIGRQEYGERYAIKDSGGNRVPGTVTDSKADSLKILQSNIEDNALRNEGDVMGHCVGGYCESVHEGDSKIYSLRDNKGMSHVTVEVIPGKSNVLDPVSWYNRIAEPKDLADLPPRPGNDLGGILTWWEGKIRRSDQYRKYVEIQTNRITSDNIEQIKGKQNRAPVDAYKPYVQDFVKNGPDGKGGKWGEVGDIENAGMEDLKGHNEPFRLAADKQFPGQRFLTKEETNSLKPTAEDFDAYQKGTLKDREQGNVDPKLLAGLGLVAGGAAIGGYLEKDQNSLWGAIKGGALTALLGSRLFPKDSRIRIDKEMNARDALVAREQLLRARAISSVVKDVPSPERRAAISDWIKGDKGVKLSPVEQKAADTMQRYFDRLNTIAQQAGVKDIFTKPATNNDIAAVAENYGRALVNAVANKTAIDALKARSLPVMVGPSKAAIKPLVMSAASKDRPPGYVDFGKSGLVAHPDIAPSLRFLFDQNTAEGFMRGTEMASTAAKRSLVSFSMFHATSLTQAFLGADKLRLGYPIAGAIAGGTAAYVAGKADPITYALLAGGVAGMIPGVRTIARAAKPNTLLAPLAGAAIGYGLAPQDNKLMGTMLGAGVGLMPRFAEDDKYVKAMRDNDPQMAGTIDKLLANGLKVSHEGGALNLEDVSGQGSFYGALTAARDFLDKRIPHGGLPVDAVIKINHAVDGFMWERLQASYKLQIGMAKYEEMLANNVKANKADPAKNPLRTTDQIAADASSFTNNMFGSLDWRRVAEEARTKWGRDFMMSVLSPQGRRVIQLVEFAPDWLISTTRAATRAFGEGTGIKGLYQPQTLADLHRQYLMRSAFYYTMIGEGLNQMFTGHGLEDNKDRQGNPDPLHVYIGDGRRLNISKHFLDPFHLAMAPGSAMLSKVNVLPKEAMNQAEGTDFLTVSNKPPFIDGPAMKMNPWLHAVRSVSPITASQAMGESGAQASALSAFGISLTGKTDTQRALEKEQRKAENKLKYQQRRQAR